MADEWNVDSEPWGKPPSALPIYHPTYLIADQTDVDSAGTEFRQVGGEFLTTEDDPSTPYIFYLEKQGLILEAEGIRPSSVKLITMVYPVIQGPVGTEVIFYLGGDIGQPDEDLNLYGPYTFVIGSSRKIDCLITCRYPAFTMTVNIASSPAKPVILEAIGFEFAVIGED